MKNVVISFIKRFYLPYIIYILYNLLVKEMVMKKTKNERVQRFIDEIRDCDIEKYKILQKYVQSFLLIVQR